MRLVTAYAQENRMAQKIIKEPTAKDFMNKSVLTVDAEMTVEQATLFFIEKEISSAPVVKSKKSSKELVGFLSEADCLKALSNEIYFSETDLPVKGIMKTQPICVSTEASLFSLASIFIQNNFRHLPVIDKGKLAGIVSRKDILKAFYRFLQEEKKSGDKRRKKVDYEQVMNKRFILG